MKLIFWKLLQRFKFLRMNFIWTQNWFDGKFLKVVKVENTDITLILWIFVCCVDARTQFYINDFQLIIRVLEKYNFLFLKIFQRTSFMKMYLTSPCLVRNWFSKSVDSIWYVFLYLQLRTKVVRPFFVKLHYKKIRKYDVVQNDYIFHVFAFTKVYQYFCPWL